MQLLECTLCIVLPNVILIDNLLWKSVELTNLCISHYKIKSELYKFKQKQMIIYTEQNGCTNKITFFCPFSVLYFFFFSFLSLYFIKSQGSKDGINKRPISLKRAVIRMNRLVLWIWWNFTSQNHLFYLCIKRWDGN